MQGRHQFSLLPHEPNCLNRQLPEKFILQLIALAFVLINDQKVH